MVNTTTTRSGQSWLKWGLSGTMERRRRRRTRQRNSITRRLESLEERTLLNASIDIDANGLLTYTTDNASFERVDISVVGNVCAFDSSVDIDVLTNAPPLAVTGDGTPLVAVTGISGLVVNVEGSSAAINVASLNVGATINLNSRDASVFLGDSFNPGGLGALTAPIMVTSPGTSTNNVLAVNDSGSSASVSYTVTPTTLTATNGFGGLTYSGVLGLTALGSGGPNDFVVQGTADGAGTTLIGGALGSSNGFIVEGTSADAASSLSLRGGIGPNTFDLRAASSPVTINAGGETNTVNLGNFGDTAGLASSISVENLSARTRVDIFVDRSAGSFRGAWNLAKQAYPSTSAVLTGFSPHGSLIYDPFRISSLNVTSPDGHESPLTVDFGNGNPIPSLPATGPGLSFEGGGDSAPASKLILKGGLLTDEIHDAKTPGSGDLHIDGTWFSYSEIWPHGLYDSAPVENYVFNNAGDPGIPVLVTGAQDSALLGDVRGLLIEAPGSFIDTHIANKTKVTVNANPSAFGGSVTVHDTSTVPVAGLWSLTVTTNGADDTADLVYLPFKASTLLRQGAGADQTTFSILGSLVSTATTLDGGSGANVLTLDAHGLPITPANFSGYGGGSTEISLSQWGGKPISYVNYERVYVNGLPPAPPTVTGAIIKATPGQRLVDAIAATFTSGALGAKASDFTAMIYWGDGSFSPGVIVEGASDPAVFYVTGTHTYSRSSAPLETVVVIHSNGSAGEQIINGVPVTFRTPGGGPVQAIGSAVVNNGSIALTGRLNPASDSGASNSDAITNVVQPNFFGAASEPGAVVVLYATPRGGAPILIGRTTVALSGAWSITPGAALSNGAYAIQARAYDASGHSISALTTIAPNLIIDTVGPRITGARLGHLAGRVGVVFEDFGGPSNAGTGLVQSSLLDANNYQFSMLRPPLRGLRGGSRWPVTAVDVQPGTSVGPQLATIRINNGRPIRPGRYVLDVSSAIRDTAGNALEGQREWRLGPANRIPIQPVAPPRRPGGPMAFRFATMRGFARD